MLNKINLGIIGKNFGYNVIYKSFLKNKRFKVKAFSFKSKKKNNLKLPKNIKIYSDWKKMILDKKIHAVAIATPPILHKNIIKFAIKNNKHIFCEKPFTTSSKDANHICKLIKKKKNISHMVNYEFSNIDAFFYFKRKILNNIKINKIYLNWFIKIQNRPVKKWKDNFNKGGGIIFNYACHALYYLENLLGKIVSIKSKITIDKNSKIKSIKADLFFKKKIKVKINMKVGAIPNLIIPTHELKIISSKNIYLLKTKLNSLSDKFSLLKFDENNKHGKFLFKNKKNNYDFRINPTFNNSQKFSSWILSKKTESPNFFDAERIHLIVNKMILSSKIKKQINIS